MLCKYRQMRCKRSSPRLTEKSPAAGGVTIKSARWSFPKFPASSHCPPGCDWSLQSLLLLSHPFPTRSYLPRLGEGLDKRRQHGPGPLPPFQLRSLPSPHFQEIQTRMEVRVGVVSGAGREGELRFAPAEERTHAHTHIHRHVGLTVRVTPQRYTDAHCSDTSLTGSTTQIRPSSTFLPSVLCSATSVVSDSLRPHGL